MEALLDKQCPRDGVTAPGTRSLNRCKGKNKGSEKQERPGLMWECAGPVSINGSQATLSPPHRQYALKER